MSFDSRPSFRQSAKEKFRKVISSNKTSSIREKITANEVYQDLSEKSRNLTKTIAEKTGLDAAINKTKSIFSSQTLSNGNDTIPKGFFDSLFSPQTTNDLYMKVAIICLWIVAVLCILTTIITMFVSIKNNGRKNASTRWIFLHVFVCELCYLIYVLLSMINVGLNFQLNAFWCDIGKYFMYATVPVMYFVLVILFFERVVTYCKNESAILGKLKSSWCIQLCIMVIWIVAIVLISVFIHLKNRAKNSVKSVAGKYLPNKWILPLSETLGAGKCSIDGQLLPFFKILFIVLLVLIIILFIKSTVISFMYSFFTWPCLTSMKKNKKSADDHMTLVFIIILFLNLVLSFPFYFVSTANSIVDTFRGNESFTVKLKVCFILRLISIILQCFIFYTLDSGCWNLLQKIIDCISCQKSHPKRTSRRSDEQSLRVPTSDSEESELPAKSTSEKKKAEKKRKDSTSSSDSSSDSSSSSSSSKSSEDSDDDVFTDDPAHVSGKAEKSAKTKSTSTDSSDSDSDDERKKLTTNEKSPTTKSPLKRDQSIKDKPVTIETKVEVHSNNTLSRTKSNRKSPDAQKSSSPIDQKTSKSPAIETQQKSEITVVSNSSPEKIVSSNPNKKPTSTTVESETQPIVHRPYNRVRSPRRYRSYQRQWKGKPRMPQSAQPISTQHRYSQLPTDPIRPSETRDNHVDKPKEIFLRSARIHSTEV